MTRISLILRLLVVACVCFLLPTAFRLPTDFTRPTLGPSRRQRRLEVVVGSCSATTPSCSARRTALTLARSAPLPLSSPPPTPRYRALYLPANGRGHSCCGQRGQVSSAGTTELRAAASNENNNDNFINNNMRNRATRDSSGRREFLKQIAAGAVLAGCSSQVLAGGPEEAGAFCGEPYPYWAYYIDFDEVFVPFKFEGYSGTIFLRTVGNAKDQKKARTVLVRVSCCRQHY